MAPLIQEAGARLASGFWDGLARPFTASPGQISDPFHDPTLLSYNPEHFNTGRLHEFQLVLCRRILTCLVRRKLLLSLSISIIAMMTIKYMGFKHLPHVRITLWPAADQPGYELFPKKYSHRGKSRKLRDL